MAEMIPSRSSRGWPRGTGTRRVWQPVYLETKVPHMNVKLKSVWRSESPDLHVVCKQLAVRTYWHNPSPNQITCQHVPNPHKKGQEKSHAK